MNPYPKYKDSGVEWIGDIPIDWTTIPIKRLSPVKRGASPRPIADPKYFDDNGEYAWVRIADVSASNRYLENTTQQLSEIGSSLSVKQFPGDLFLSIAGTVGKPIITKIKCCIHDGFVYFPNLKVDPEYLYYVFSTGEPYKGLGKWGTQLNLNTETVGYIPISLPPYEHEISRIVKFLDEKTAQIDDLISKKQKLIELLKEKRAAIINQAVTKGLNPDAPMKDSGIEWLGEVPEHWEVIRMRYVFKLLSGNGFPNHCQGKIEGDYPFYKVSDINLNGINVSLANNYVTRADVVKNGWTIIPKKSILLAKIGEALKKNHRKINVSECLIDNNMLVLIKKNNSYNISYLYYLMLLIDMVWFINPGAVPSIDLNKLRDFFVAIPKKAEQKQIAAHLDRKTSKIDQTTSKIEKKIELLKEFHTALISEVVTGKIDVRDEGLNG